MECCCEGFIRFYDLLFCSIAECFSFLVCTKWSNPVIHRNSREASSSSSTTIRYLDWNSGLVVSTDENRTRERICSIQDIGGHFMKVPIIVFQVLLCMHLEVYDTELCAWSALGILFLEIWDVFHSREHLLLLYIYHFQLFSLRFSYFKELEYCYLHLN